MIPYSDPYTWSAVGDPGEYMRIYEMKGVSLSGRMRSEFKNMPSDLCGLTYCDPEPLLVPLEDSLTHGTMHSMDSALKNESIRIKDPGNSTFHHPNPYHGRLCLRHCVQTTTHRLRKASSSSTCSACKTSEDAETAQGIIEMVSWILRVQETGEFQTLSWQVEKDLPTIGTQSWRTKWKRTSKMKWKLLNKMMENQMSKIMEDKMETGLAYANRSF